jgi:hypothetical protein
VIFTRAGLIAVSGIAALACAEEEQRAPILPPDPDYVMEHPLCTAQASAYYADGGCLGPKRFFGEDLVMGTRCPVAPDAGVCVSFSAEAGTPLGQRTWVFSGEHYGIPDGRTLVACDPQTAAAAIAAPRCPE